MDRLGLRLRHPVSPDRGRLIATSALGLLLGLLAMASGRTLVHRRTRRPADAAT